MDLVTPSIGFIFWHLFFILTKFAWKPILNLIKQRDTHLHNSLEAAQKVRSEIRLFHLEKDNWIKESRIERDLLLKEARIMSDKIREEAKKKIGIFIPFLKCLLYRLKKKNKTKQKKRNILDSSKTRRQFLY
ncbi:F0F1 ATP synthase subunit B family protein [Candidatus Walczuchella monophlebidarum]|uniref:F0F1 ATP synthase subunit B n=1 Tax=Candidatus Walczuchella monophlebidarum TaxID=1415657 RepID=A0A068DQG7_9FLAO|nr:hypothetical protein [Candidatus Walczuchella monophlebidarum]AID37492.1 F0F1 ATP synthase subunit B [Candidatus Walczuchella monophlebidarum]